MHSSLGNFLICYLTLERLKAKGEKEVARMRWLDSNTDSMDMNLSKLQEMVEDRGAWHAVVQGVTESQTWLND